MRHAFATAAAAVLVALASVSPAAAKCTRLAFSVNDYGKDGPTKDAKSLLDKYVAQWTAERGIKSYRTGKKDVNCELFLNFIVFDEHTCKAEATVCWDDKSVGPVPKQATKLPDGAAPPATAKPKTPAKAAPAGKAAAGKSSAKAAAPLTTGTLPAAAPAAVAPSAPAPAAPSAIPPVAPAAPPAAASPDKAG